MTDDERKIQEVLTEQYDAEVLPDTRNVNFRDVTGKRHATTWRSK